MQNPLLKTGSRTTSGGLDKRRFLQTMGLASAGLLTSGVPLGADPARSRKPNVVFILADDLGYCDTNLYSCRDIHTPGIRSIAENGISFTDGHVTAPLCSPSRAGLITGRYQNRFGFEFNCGGARRAHEMGLGLPLAERTLADSANRSEKENGNSSTTTATTGFSTWKPTLGKGKIWPNRKPRCSRSSTRTWPSGNREW